MLKVTEQELSVSQFLESAKKQIEEYKLYIVEVIEEGQKYQYEYSNIKHAKKHFDNEKNFCYLFGYSTDGNYYLMDYK